MKTPVGYDCSVYLFIYLFLSMLLYMINILRGCYLLGEVVFMNDRLLNFSCILR